MALCWKVQTVQAEKFLHQLAILQEEGKINDLKLLALLDNNEP